VRAEAAAGSFTLAWSGGRHFAWSDADRVLGPLGKKAAHRPSRNDQVGNRSAALGWRQKIDGIDSRSLERFQLALLLPSPKPTPTP